MDGKSKLIAETSRKARKIHICGNCGKSIPTGATYIYTKIAPWDNWEGDSDENGRPTAVRYRDSHWKSNYTCNNCYANLMGQYYYG